jgi:hypothetical protein
VEGIPLIKDLNQATNLIALVVIMMGLALAVLQPDSTIANTLVSAGVGAITAATAVGRSQESGKSPRPELPNQPEQQGR